MSRRRSRIVFLLLILILLAASALTALVSWWLSHDVPQSIDQDPGIGSSAGCMGGADAGAGHADRGARR